MRDPRKDPRKGDVIRMPDTLHSYEIAKVDGDVFFYGRDGGRWIPMSFCLLSVWPKLAAQATVIHAADDDAPLIDQHAWPPYPD
jgi:hypothetical protein